MATGRCGRLAPAPYKDGRADSAQDAKDGEEEAVISLMFEVQSLKFKVASRKLLVVSTFPRRS